MGFRFGSSASEKTRPCCVMSACSAIHKPLESVLRGIQAFGARTFFSSDLGAVRGDVKSFPLLYRSKADVLLHRNLVIDVLRAICDRT